MRTCRVLGAGRDIMRTFRDVVFELDPEESDPRDRLNAREFCRAVARRPHVPVANWPRREEA